MTPSPPLRVAILDDYQGAALRFGDWDRLGNGVDLTVFDRNLAIEEAATALAPFAVLCLMRERMPLPRALIEALPNLKLVVFTGVRTHSIDFEAAAACGVTVAHTGAGESHAATAELAWGLILSAMRHLPQEFARMRAGAWQSTVGTVLHGKTLGLLGLGKLGQRMAGIGAAYGMLPIAWSPNLTPERAQDAGVARVERDELFARADVLSIHMVLAASTRHLVGARELGLMQTSAVLVNTARGPIVDEAALVEALRTRRIRAAALDVYDQEPLPVDHPLRGLDNAILSPHLGYVTEGTYRDFFRDTVAAIAAWRTAC